MENENQLPKKKWYKKWWVITLLVFLFLIFIGIIGGGNNKGGFQEGMKQGYSKPEENKPAETNKPEPRPAEQQLEVTKNWYEGGTLHKSTIAEWKTATDENKLATSADFMANIDKTVSLDELKNRAVDMKNCIDKTTTETETKSDEPVANIAGLCAVIGGYEIKK